MRILIDQEALDTMSRDLVGAANRLQELAAAVQSAVDGIELPASAANAVRLEVDSALAAMRTTSDALAAESNVLSHKSSCCGGAEGNATGALPSLAMDSWAVSAPSPADTTLGLGSSALIAALTTAIVDFQSTATASPGSPGNGFTVIEQGPISEFEQLGFTSSLGASGGSPSERAGLGDGSVGLGSIMAPTGSWMNTLGIVDQANPYADIVNVVAAPRRSFGTGGSILDGIDLTPAITRQVSDYTFGLNRPGASPFPGGIVNFMYNPIVSGPSSS